jgi:hypothetical protein
LPVHFRKYSGDAIPIAIIEDQKDQRQSPFELLMDEFGHDRAKLPVVTNGELMRIAEVDRATMHGWLYLKRQLTEVAREKIRLRFRKDRPGIDPD